MFGNFILVTNEIPDITVGGQIVMQNQPQKLEGGGPPCVLCKAVTEEVLRVLNGSVDPVRFETRKCVETFDLN